METLSVCSTFADALLVIIFIDIASCKRQSLICRLLKCLRPRSRFFIDKSRDFLIGQRSNCSYEFLWVQFSLVQFLITIANASTYKSLPPFPAYYCSINSCIHLQMSSFTNHICKARLLKMWLALQDSSCTKAQTQTHIYDVRTSVTTQGSQPAGRCLWFDRLFVFSHKPQLRFSAHPARGVWTARDSWKSLSVLR